MEFDREEMRRQLAKVRNECVCTANERAFLDEIREKYRYVKDKETGQMYIVSKTDNVSIIFQHDFPNTPLKELVNE